RVAEELAARDERDRDPAHARRHRGRLGDRAVTPTDEELARQEAAQPGRDEVDGDAGHDVVDAEGDGGQAEEQTAEGTADAAPDERRPRPPHVPGPTGEPGAQDHHALEADVHDPGPLGPQATEASEEDG